MSKIQVRIMSLLAVIGGLNVAGLLYLWNLQSQSDEYSAELRREFEDSRTQIAALEAKLEDFNQVQTAKQASKEQRKVAAASGGKKSGNSAKAVNLDGGEGMPSGSIQVPMGLGDGISGKAPFEMKTNEKSTKSDRYSNRIRTSLEQYAQENGIEQAVVDEAVVIIEAWADDRRFYKEAAQAGDLSSDEARAETRAGLSDVQEQLRLLFGEEHYVALDDTISFLGRLQGKE